MHNRRGFVAAGGVASSKGKRRKVRITKSLLLWHIPENFPRKKKRIWTSKKEREKQKEL